MHGQQNIKKDHYSLSYYSLRNNPEERISQLLRGGSLKSQSAILFPDHSEQKIRIPNECLSATSFLQVSVKHILIEFHGYTKLNENIIQNLPHNRITSFLETAIYSDFF